MKEFELSTTQLKEIADQLRQRIREGLAKDGQEVQCLPTYLRLPPGDQSGAALVIDTGGTNMRAALVTLEPKDGAIVSGPVSKTVPGRAEPPLDSDAFFSAQAQLTDGLSFENKDALPLGYCFSYPAESRSDGDAVLLRWTKGINITGVIGKPVGRPLADALKKRGVPTEGCSVLNDTVASLLGGAHLYASPRYGYNYIGLILGTGTNMAGVFSPEHLTKVEADYPMVVNLESGNFNPLHLNRFDDEVDRELNPGAQRFEKAISGHYLPYIFEKVCPGVFDPEEGTGRLVEIRDAGGEHSEVAAAILRRSARLAAAGIAALTSFYPKDKETAAVLGEGTLLWGDPQYAPTLESTLAELLPPGQKVELVRQRENVNLLGAASAALSQIQ